MSGSSEAKSSGSNGGGAGSTAPSEDVAEQVASPEQQVGVDSTGNPVMRQTRFDVPATAADSQNGIQRGRGSGRGSNK